jgi:hypothetical protein
MGALQAPLSPSPVTIVRDPTDLLALPFALVAWWLPRAVDDEIRPPARDGEPVARVRAPG